MVAGSMQQQCNSWYYQHQQQQQQQYSGENSCEPNPSVHWPYAQPTYLQYQQHQAAAYQQQQQQQTQLTIQQQHSIGWNNEIAKNNIDNNTVHVNEPSHALNCSGGSAGSDIGSPSTPASITEDMRINANQSPFDWIKKSSHQLTPGKTRTKDKYRVVYTEHQRLELEKEFYSSKYITTNRKAELSAAVALSERQIKIWFQNRRAKERKLSKKHSDMELEQQDIKPILDAHGVAHPPPIPAPSPLTAMADLSLHPTTMNGLMSNLQPPAPATSTFMTHHLQQHQHPTLGPQITATGHHPQHPLINSWNNTNHGV